MIKERILTIDDDPDILDVLALTLSEQYEIFQAGNGEEGLKALKQKNPDLIILRLFHASDERAGVL